MNSTIYKNTSAYRLAKKLLIVLRRYKLAFKYLENLMILKIRHSNDEMICEYPSTIQLPITFKCNFDCVMCGMRNLITKKDITTSELTRILEDRLFQNITGVGLNGGEPFLRKDLIECVEILITRLPKLKDLNIISNGYFTEIIEEKLEKIYFLCRKNGIELNISFSLDGIGEMQNFMRGNDKSWEKINNTLEMIKTNKERFCDKFQVICTVTKYNVYNLPEVEVWAKANGIDISYNIATINERISNHEKLNDFTIFNDDKAKMVACEFFYRKAIELKSQKYFGLYLFIKDGIRYALCPCRNNNWVTLTPGGEICYCATHSKELGNALDVSAYKIFNDNTDHLKYIRSNYCDCCSHYMNRLDERGLKLFYNELIHQNKMIY